jgi:predicted secreted hydrolase
MDPRSPQQRSRTSAWAADDFYLLHLAVSDIDGARHADYEALERGVLGMAGATDAADVPDGKPDAVVKVWTHDSVFARGATGWTLKTASPRIALDLTLNESPSRPAPVLHGAKGEEGLSRKGPKPGQASYYYSVPRLATAGTLTLDGRARTIVRGLSWMDHEFGSNQLSREQSGWEWFAIHLDNGADAMLYVLRNKDGSIEPSSSGTWIDARGRAAHFNVDATMVAPGRVWTSPVSGVRYPLEWTLKLPAAKAELTVRAKMDDQEFHSEKNTGLNYYEGAVRIGGSVDGKTVTGDGYLEITGGALGGKM